MLVVSLVFMSGCTKTQPTEIKEPTPKVEPKEDTTPAGASEVGLPTEEIPTISEDVNTSIEEPGFEEEQSVDIGDLI
jgi:hypothetical protein